MIKKIFILSLLLQSLFSFSQIPNLSDKAIFSVLTVDVANASHTLYGHTALRVNDSIAGFDVVYNYGMFDFSTSNFLLKFTKGDLQYYAAVYPYADFEYSYREENRSIYEQKLHLSLSEKQALFQKLNQSVFSEEKFYTYKFIDRNCTTKVIDVINSVLKDKPIQNNLHKDENYREVLYGYQQGQFWLNFGINIIFGHRPDEQAAVLFLPIDLLEVLKTAQHDGKALAEKPTDLFIATPLDSKFSFWNSIYPLIVFLSIIVLVNKKGLNLFYFSILGLIGLFFVAVNLYSLHREVLWNYNMLLFNPLYLVLAYFLIKNNTIWIKKIALICLLCLGAYLIYLLNKAHLLMMLPLIIATGIVTGRLYLKKEQ
ncbi:lipoprotein N-acyltransferase Lnb domain-containing protein [Flavobacterium amnicola]|uniref:lipoprotein N-acyltransferase Lnb domain-containing protein n=1 Tax=Flavobacterium amnicola TaxID=2506422 RepID=UPI001F379CA0|nr:DUF4105 domain-containing protein [Flavobacterium amnicola]